MGRVYRARHVFLDRPAAIKVLRRDARTDPDSVQRFQREALAASKVGHPSIVEVSDFAMMADGQVFLAMELLEGESLEAWMERPGTLDQAVSHLAQVADGLAAAHRAGVIHRDIKPANIFLAQATPNAPIQAKLLDFGIAKMATERVGGYTTNNGAVLGTPYYLAPERARGNEPDPRADIYSLGVILYEMLTGTLPFVADNFMAILGHHMRTPPVDPRLAAPDRAMPDEIAALCMAMLAKDPAERPSDADRVAAQLAGLRRRRAAELKSVATGPRSGVSSADADTQQLPASPTQTADAITAAIPTALATSSLDPSPRAAMRGHEGAASPAGEGARRGGIVIAVALVIGAVGALAFLEIRRRPGPDTGAEAEGDGPSEPIGGAPLEEASPPAPLAAKPSATARVTAEPGAAGSTGVEATPAAKGDVEDTSPAAAPVADGKTSRRSPRTRKRPRPEAPAAVEPESPPATATDDTKTKAPPEIKDDIYGD